MHTNPVLIRMGGRQVAEIQESIKENKLNKDGFLKSNEINLSKEQKDQLTDDANTKSSSKKNDPLEIALRKFKKQSSGIISEVRKREAYDKPSVKRKKKSKEARKHKKMGKYGSRW